MNAFEMRHVSKTYKNFTLKDLNLTLPSGCIMGLIGENGAGKSTAIRLLLELTQKDSGEISILGVPGCPPQIKEDIGIVLDDVGIPNILSAQKLEKILGCMYKNWDKDVFYKYLRLFSVPNKKAFKDMSKGMQMKLGIAAALSHHPKLLVLDEATSNLDPVARDMLLDIFMDFTRDENHSILISSHIVSDLEKICDYVAFLHKGSLMLYGEKDGLKEKYGMIRCSRETFASLNDVRILGKKITPYGVEAVAERATLPHGMEADAVDMEQMFIFAVKEEIA